MSLARRKPLRSRRVWKATETQNKRTEPGDWRRLREACRDRAGGYCQAGIPGVCEGERDDGSFRPIGGGHAHHLLRRSQGGPDELDNLAWLCGFCHGLVHARVEWAYDVGLLRRRHRDADPYPWTPDEPRTAWEAIP